MNKEKPDTTLYNLPFHTAGFDTMPYRNLGSSGLKVSDIGLGTWKMGYPETGDGSRTDEIASLAILDRAAELHVNFWDTANRYNNSSGNSERIIGTWFNKNPDRRRDIVLGTKVSGLMDGRTPNHCGLSRTNILDSVYVSLERLQTDYIDILYFHSYDASTPAEESLLAVEDLIRQDLVRYFAVSNFTVDQLEEFRDAGGKISPRSRIIAVQNQFDILGGERGDYTGVMDYAIQNKLSYVPWSPMAGGLLTNRYLTPGAARSGDRLYDEGVVDSRNTEAVNEKLHRLADIARTSDVELSQLVIAYMLSLPAMGPVIASASNAKQLESNAAAASLALTEEQKDLIAQILI